MAFESPILKKEFLTLLRGRKAYVFLFVTVLFSILFCLIFWPSEGSPFYRYGAEAGRNFFIALSFALLGLVTLITTAFTAGSFSGEKERQTYDLLFLTLLRPASILVAKLISSIGFLLLLMVSLLPVFSVGLLIGGVEFQEIAESFGIIIISIITFGIIGMACSLIFRKTTVSFIISELSVLFVAAGQIFTLLAFFYVKHWLSRLWGFTRYSYFEPPEEILIFGGPFVALFSVIENVGPLKNISIPGIGLSIPLRYLIVAEMLLISAMLFVFMLFKVRRPPQPPKIKRKRIIDDRDQLKRRRRRFPFYLTDPLKRSKPIGDTINPLLVKELRYGLPGRSDALIRMFYVSLILFFTIAIFCIGLRNEGFLVLSTIEIVLILIFVPGSTVSIACREESQGNVDALRMTLLGPSRIIQGKYLAALLHMLSVAGPAVLINAMFLLTVNYFRIESIYVHVSERIGMFIFFLGSVSVSVLLACAIGFFSATLLKKTLPSIVLAYLLSLVFFVGNSLLFLIAKIYHIPALSEELIAFLSPLLGYIYCFNEVSSDKRLLYCFANWSLFLVVAALFYLFSWLIFKRYRMRD